jgi:predicted nucleic acid-binding protein
MGHPIAVIDSTLLSRLAELNLADSLPYIFKQIRIPPEVRREAYKAPNKKRLRNLLNDLTGFFIDCHETDIVNQEFLKTIVDAGEAAVIAQAKATNSVVITDDKEAHNQALKREIEVFRTGKILCLLKDAGVISLVKPYLDTLMTLGLSLNLQDRKTILILANELSNV